MGAARHDRSLCRPRAAGARGEAHICTLQGRCDGAERPSAPRRRRGVVQGSALIAALLAWRSWAWYLATRGSTVGVRPERLVEHVERHVEQVRMDTLELGRTGGMYAS